MTEEYVNASCHVASVGLRSSRTDQQVVSSVIIEVASGTDRDTYFLPFGETEVSASFMLEQVQQLGFTQHLATIDPVSHSFFNIEQDRSGDADDVVIDTVTTEVEGGVNRLPVFIIVVETHVSGDPWCRDGEIDLGRGAKPSTNQVRHIGNRFRVVIVQ